MANASAYRAITDVSFPKVVAKISDDDYAVEGVNYPAGSLIPHGNLTPRDQKRAESGELDHLLAPVNDGEYDRSLDFESEPEFGIFVAEHEAEAHALREAGHHVIPKTQVLESLSGSAKHVADYQAAAEAAGVTERPAQAYMAQAESDAGRIPDHLLHGTETRSGMPHNRGLQNPPEDDEGVEEGSDDSPTTRARPDRSTQSED